MENKHHTVKFWGGKDKVQTVEYIAVSAVQQWIDEMAEERKVDLGSLLVLVKLETFLNEKK